MTNLKFIASLSNVKSGNSFNYYADDESCLCVRIGSTYDDILARADWDIDILSEDLNDPDMYLDEIKKSEIKYILEHLDNVNDDGMFNLAIKKVKEYRKENR